MALILDLAEEVLKEASQPLTYMEIWKEAKTRGIPERLKGEGREIRGKTPCNTLSSSLGGDVEKPDSRFFMIRVPSPRRFFLKSRRSELTQEVLAGIQTPESGKEKESQSEAGFSEKDLHPLLAYFVRRSPEFWGEREIYTKTIDHEKSTRGPIAEKWLYPDMVGVYLPFDEMDKGVIDLNQTVGPDSLIRFCSFELKKRLTTANCRESFFQAVSNSSWAHEGYLVAAVIDNDNDPELKRELERLTNSFGIGIIHLDRDDIDASKVMYPAQSRASLDWETINKLYDRNSDFQKFIIDVQKDIKIKTIRLEQYDKIPEPPE